MIQKGIIAQVIDKYNYKVRIPKYDKIESATYSTKLDDLSSGIVCSIPGIDIAYVEGDVVLVSFENDELSKPVILGLLYREEKKDSDILVKGVDESLTDIKDDLDKLNSQSLFTHLKYSDDNGITFTSLFSSQNYESNAGSAVVCQPYFDDESTIGIKIDKGTKAISWSILDENNADITDEIEIETIVFDSNNNIIKRERGRNNRLITINNSSKIDSELYLTYRIYTTKKYLDTLHVRLSTDKEPFGVRVGEYVGLYLSFDSTPSTTPADYTWFPIASGAAIDAEINSKIAKLAAEMNELLNEFKLEVDENFVTLFYKEVTWTQAEVDTYCEIGYQDSWTRSPNGYQGAVKAGNILYITVHNTGSSASLEDDTYGRLEIRALEDTPAGQPVNGRVIGYNVSGEVAIDALARFKSSLLEEGNETLIYGGHIETDSITANQIQTNTLQLGQSQIIHLTEDLANKPNKGEVVTELEIEYATGNSPTSHTDIQESEWGTSPIWTAGKYMWQRTTKRMDNIVSQTFACIQGAKGEPGDPGNSPTIGADGYWYINGQSTGVKAEGEDGTGIASVELYSTSGNNKTYRITFTDGTHFDYVVTDGTDSYTLVLTNESHTFPGSTSAATSSSTDCGIIAYKGSSRVACYAGASASATSIPTGVTGLTCSIANNNTQNVTLTFSATTSLTTQKGEVTIPINVGGEAFEKTFSWSVAYTGSSAAVYNLTATPSALIRNSTTLSPSTVTFNATRTFGTGAPSPYNVYWLIQEFNGTTWVDKYSTPSGSGESSRQYAPTTTAVLVRANIYSEFAHTNLLDTQSVGIAKDGGTPYIQGGYWYINGQSTGIVAEGKDGTSIVWKGTLDTPPANPEANWCYRNSTNGITYIYSGTTWVMMTQDGQDGAPGVSVSSVTNHYLATSYSSGVTTSDSPSTYGTWSTSIQTMTSVNQYLWTYETVTGSNGSTLNTTTPIIIGRYGQNGTNGTSVTISSIKYTTSTTETQPADSTFTSSTVPTVDEGNWLWTRTLYSDGSKIYTKSKQGKSGTNGTSPTVSSTSVSYQKSTSGTAVPTGNWSTTPLAPTSTEYVWTKTVITYSDGATATSYSVGGKAGTNGTNGTNGTDGIGITGIVEWYQISNDNINPPATPTAAGTGYSSTPIATSSTYPYLWNYEVISYTSGSPTITAARVIGTQGEDGKMIYGTCATSMSTEIKNVTCGVTELYEGLAITVKFANGNSYMNPSLKVGTTATKNIYVDNAAVNTTNNKLYWTANAVMTFIYDGTGWVLTDKPVSYKATCEAAGAAAGKTIYVGEGAVIRKNTTLQCKFTAAHNSSAAATVTIKAASGADAICSSVPLKINDVNVTNDTCVTWSGGQTVPLVFDGAQWNGAISFESKVEITVDSIDYTNSTITLRANLYVNGLLVTPSTIDYNWTKNNLTNSIGTSQTLTVNDFASIYNCEITW